MSSVFNLTPNTVYKTLFIIILFIGLNVSYGKENNKENIMHLHKMIKDNSEQIKKIIKQNPWLIEDGEIKLLAANNDIIGKLDYNTQTKGLFIEDVELSDEAKILKTIVKAQTGFIKAIQLTNKKNDCKNAFNFEDCKKVFRNTFNSNNLWILNNSFRINSSYESIKPVYYDESGI